MEIITISIMRVLPKQLLIFVELKGSSGQNIFKNVVIRRANERGKWVPLCRDVIIYCV